MLPQCLHSCKLEFLPLLTQARQNSEQDSTIFISTPEEEEKKKEGKKLREGKGEEGIFSNLEKKLRSNQSFV